MSDKIYSIDFHPQVKSDYEGAYDWYELQQVGLGERFLMRMNEKLKTLFQSPEIFGTKLRKGYREAKIDGFPYLIVYRVYSKNKRIFINGIHHEKMDPKKRYRA